MKYNLCLEFSSLGGANGHTIMKHGLDIPHIKGYARDCWIELEFLALQLAQGEGCNRVSSKYCWALLFNKVIQVLKG